MNVRAGQKAIVIYGINAGRIVQVIRPYEGRKDVIDGHTWNAGRYKNEFIWVIVSLGSPFITKSSLKTFRSAPCQDDALRPLLDLPEEELEAIEELEFHE